MWVIIDYKSQFGAKMTGGKKRWGNNPGLQYSVAALLSVHSPQSTQTTVHTHTDHTATHTGKYKKATSLARLGQGIN